jgi:hypothetical protein
MVTHRGVAARPDGLRSERGALDLLAVDRRWSAVLERLERLDGVRRPAERLEAVYAELAR